MAVRGFILQPTYRIEQGRPVVHLFGKLENGESFLIRDDREVPHFYIEAGAADRARQLGAERILPSRRLTMSGSPLCRVDLRLPSDTPPLRNHLQANRVHCYEADVRFAMRPLIDRGIRGSLRIAGEWEKLRGLGRVYTNPDMEPDSWTPRLTVLSLDIETDPRASRLLSFALYGCGASEVCLLDPAPGDSTTPAHGRFPTQAALLKHLVRRVQRLDPDILTGWNVVDFDFHVLDRIARECGVALSLGRGGEALRMRPSRSPRSRYEARVPGRVVLDGIELLRGAFIKMDNYSLDFVAQKVVGEGKTLSGPDKPAEILWQYKHDPQRFAQYNLNDARLVVRILDELRLIELSCRRSLLTGLPLERVSGSIAAFDFLYLSRLHRRGIVAPSVRAGRISGENPGGHVLEPQTGIHPNVLVFDFKSLYPSLIRTFQIDPLGMFPPGSEEGEDSILAPNGVSFSRQPGILPQMLDELFPQREEAIRRGDSVTSHALKILMNSFYGVLGTPACRFFQPGLATAITTFGRDILLWSKSRIEEADYQVLYGDTDSLFVLSGRRHADDALAEGRSLAAAVNADLRAHIQRTWGVESRLELQLETLYLKLHLPEMRRGGGGARKRYVGLVQDKGGRAIVFKGMESVRRDWTALAKQVQNALYRRLFNDEGLGEYLAGVVARVRAGEEDPLLVYRKGLRRKLDSYTTTTPPHVAAARKLSTPPGRIISYLMTTQGPEPEAERKGEIDYEHYVQKQIRPIAEPLLALQNLRFDKVIGDDRQLELF